jgi:hypothetical protein
MAYKCPECSFHYETAELARKCEAYCKKYNSCSLEITKYALENKK